MLRSMGWSLGILGMVLIQHPALAAGTCSREEIREMIFSGSSMRQVEETCSNAREAFSRPLPDRPAPPPPAAVAPDPEPPPETVTAPSPEPLAVTTDDGAEAMDDAAPMAESAPTATNPPTPAPPPRPDPLAAPDIVAVATPGSLASSDWRARLPRIEAPQESAIQLTPLTDTPTPGMEGIAPDETAAPIADAAAPPPEVDAIPESPQLLSASAPEPAIQRTGIADDDEVPTADLSAVARPERTAFVAPDDNPAGPAITVAANSCPQTSLWWSGGPSANMEYIDICSIQLELGELDRYYSLIPFTGLNAATDRRFDEDRNGISDKGTRVGNTIFWGGRDCADGVIRIRREQCDAVDKSGCAVVSLHLQAKPGQPPTTLTLQPTFFLLYPNGSRLPSPGKPQSLNYRGCTGQ